MGDGVCIEGPQSNACFVLLCEHASRHIPERLCALGLEPHIGRAHVAWDIGALAVAQRLAAILECSLVYPTASRLVIDCNRPLDHPDLIVTETEFGPVPGNLDLPPDERERRIAEFHRPFHQAADTILERRRARGVRTALISIHSFTPILRGRARPWHFGLIHNRDSRLALQLHSALIATDEIGVGLNQPYSPSDGVYYSLARHGEANGLPCVMIEIRDDLISTSAGRERVALKLASALASAEEAIGSMSPLRSRETAR